MHNKTISSFKKVKNLGSSGGVATHHFLMQRISALCLGFLTIFTTISTVCLMRNILHAEQKIDLQYLQQLSILYYIPLILMLGIGIYHGMLGMQVIIEDYIRCKIARYFLIWSCKIFSIFTIIIFLIVIFL